jgi:hypothetical protein
MEVTYQLTAADYVQAQKACRRKNALIKWSWRLMIAFVVVFVLIAIIGIANTPADKRPSSIPLILLIAFWVYFFAAYPRIAARRNFQRMPSAQGTQTLQADHDGVRIRSSCSDWNLSWPAIVRNVELADDFLIFTSPSFVIPIPKRAFTPDQLTEFRTLLHEKIKNNS